MQPEFHIGSAATHPFESGLRHLGQVGFLQFGFGRVLAGQINQVTDQGGKLLHLRHNIVFEGFFLLIRNLGSTGFLQQHEQFNVGAHGGQWGF